MSQDGYYVRLGDEVLGPMPAAGLKELARGGRVTARTPVSKGGEKWLPAERVKGLWPARETGGPRDLDPPRSESSGPLAVPAMSAAAPTGPGESRRVKKLLLLAGLGSAVLIGSVIAILVANGVMRRPGTAPDARSVSDAGTPEPSPERVAKGDENGEGTRQAAGVAAAEAEADAAEAEAAKSAEAKEQSAARARRVEDERRATEAALIADLERLSAGEASGMSPAAKAEAARSLLDAVDAAGGRLELARHAMVAAADYLAERGGPRRAVAQVAEIAVRNYAAYRAAGLDAAGFDLLRMFDEDLRMAAGAAGSAGANQLGVVARLEKVGQIGGGSEAEALLAAARAGASTYAWDGTERLVYHRGDSDFAEAVGLEAKAAARMLDDREANFAAACDARLIAAIRDMQYTLDFREKAEHRAGRRVAAATGEETDADAIGAGVIRRLERADLARITADLEGAAAEAVRAELEARAVPLDGAEAALLAAEILGELDEAAEGRVGGFRGLLARRIAEAAARAGQGR